MTAPGIDDGDLQPGLAQALRGPAARGAGTDDDHVEVGRWLSVHATSPRPGRRAGCSSRAEPAATAPEKTGSGTVANEVISVNAMGAVRARLRARCATIYLIPDGVMS